MGEKNDCKEKRIIKARVQYFNTSSHASIDSVKVWSDLVEKLNWTKCLGDENIYFDIEIFKLSQLFTSKMESQ